ALMEAGVPIGSEAGKGYFIVDGFHLPPVMFTQEEASAMLVASKLVERMTDKSIQKTFESALMKIKAVLNDNEKDHLENLQTYIQVFRAAPSSQQAEFPDNFMSDIQKAIVTRHVLRIDYSSNNQGELTDREIEPIGLFYYSFAWHLIAWCRLRNGYRDFRTDRIINLKNTNQSFDDRNRYTLQEYLQSLKHSNHDMQEVKILLDKPVTGYMAHAKHYYGLASEEDLGDKVRMNFLVGNLRHFCRGILMQGSTVEIEHPEEAKAITQELVEELYAHYLKAAVAL
ncbi:MAG TPA: YafY family protein, partial [Ohtaekwangia sp.]|uniref:helix-turn-helix transcriptional regulator n=1 Tax=Ohtaekwangia sp. TaxID=2066019 RepID=UPI002F91F583